MVFRSQRDGWTFFLILSLFALGSVVLWNFEPLPLPHAEYFGWFFIGLSVLAFWEYATTKYEITGSDLIIRTGSSQKRIRLDGIESVTRERGIWAWLTFSAGQLRISYREGPRPGAIVVCPSEEAEFMGQLTILSPWLKGQA